MHDDIMDALQQRVGRRGFLRGSGLAIAAAAGLTLGMAASSQAQDKPQGDAQQGDKQTDEPPKKDPQDGDSADKGQGDKKEGDAAKEDPYKVTHIDASGKEYRLCPVCGSNMYRQDRTWTCENCGYSYEE